MGTRVAVAEGCSAITFGFVAIPGVMNLDQFASRGLKAQQAVDELSTISKSTDVAWLRRAAGDADKPLGVRSAAQQRLRTLSKAKKKR